jgi:hypothetical protein
MHNAISSVSNLVPLLREIVAKDLSSFNLASNLFFVFEKINVGIHISSFSWGVTVFTFSSSFRSLNSSLGSDQSSFNLSCIGKMNLLYIIGWSAQRSNHFTLGTFCNVQYIYRSGKKQLKTCDCAARFYFSINLRFESIFFLKPPIARRLGLRGFWIGPL